MANEPSTGGARAAVVLAAGKGTRMKSEKPKVAVELAGKPLLLHVLENLQSAGFERIVLVVGYKQEEVRQLVADSGLADRGLRIEFVEQLEQKGTGHAFLCAEETLADYSGGVLCTAGDMPLIRPESFVRLREAHAAGGNAVTVLSARLEDPAGYGRIVRDESGAVLRIVEEKDADDAIRRIQETNTGAYLFAGPEVFASIRRIGANNAQNEYYLPDVIAIAREAGRPVDAVILEDPSEALGCNNPDELQRLEDRLAARR